MATVVLLLLASIIFNPFLRKTNRKQDTANNNDASSLPPLTVIVLANNNAEALDAHLPIILTQDYPAGYEVVVVGEKGDIPTETVLKSYRKSTNLYSTYIPKRSLFMSKPKLAVALGVKAAHNEWIILIGAECKPSSDMWLRSIASKMDCDATIVLGYSNYSNEANQYYRFNRLRNACYLLRKATHDTAYCACGKNIAFRRSEFIGTDGYRGNLQYVNGEYHFIINKLASKLKTRIATDANAVVIEDSPTSKIWHNSNIAYESIRRHLTHRKALSMLYYTDLVMMYTNYTVIVAAVILSALSSRWLLLAVGCTALIATVVIRSVIAAKAYARFGEDLSAWRTVIYEISIIWHRMSSRLRYALSDKYNFTTHKL